MLKTQNNLKQVVLNGKFLFLHIKSLSLSLEGLDKRFPRTLYSHSNFVYGTKRAEKQKDSNLTVNGLDTKVYFLQY